MKRKKKKASRIFSFILAMMFLTTAFFSNLVDAKERNLSDNSSVDKQERIQLAQTLGLEKWIDSDGYLSEDYYKDKTDLELSEMGVAPLIHTIDLNSEVMTLSVTKYQKVSYGNTVVGYFEVDGYPSLCCEHDRRTPEAGSSTGSWEEITDANLRTVMYYGYTGPGNIFSDYNKGCVGTSLALSYYVRGLSSTGMGGPHSAGAERVGMSQLIYKAEQKASVPSGFKVYRVTTNGGSTQRLMFSIYNPKTYTSLTVQKTWNDQNNKYNLRPSSVKINLYRWSNKDSTRVLIGSANITPSNNEWNWKVTWNNLIRTDGDTIYDYTAQEEAVPGYTGKMSWEGSYEKGWVGKLTNTLQTGSVNLQKTSSVPDVTNGNDCYSLKGAEYGVYSDSSLSGASKVGVLTTDENGESNTLTLNAGTYYVRETTAPKGYALDKTTYTVTIKPNETYKLKVSDKPTLDPVGVLLGKVDKETNQNKPEGSLSLEGALFTAKFYAGVQSDSDPAVEGKTANRTWIFRTNEDGFCYYEEKYLESGDELYLSPTKNPSLPIGTLTIQETKAPEGYLINPEVYTVKITSNNNGSEFVYTYNQPTIPEQSLDLNIVKKEKGKEYAIEGAVFEHTKPDGTTETVTTDANGVCKFKTLGYGQHKIREVSVPDEYTVNEGVVTFTVAKDNSVKEPTAPIKENFEFAGWYTDKELTTKYDFTGKVTKSFTLYAKWTEQKQENGGSEDVVNNNSGNENKESSNTIVLTIDEHDALVYGTTKTNDVAPKVVNDRTMLPARFIAENLGATVEWDGEKQLVTITGKTEKQEDVTILITIGSDYAKVNGEDVKLDSPAFVENDRTYTPIRFISENLGATVEWNETEQTVTIQRVK